MLLTDVLINERAFLVCSFLEPQVWPRLRKASTCMAESLCDLILRGALMDMLTQTAKHLAAVKTPTQDSFDRVEFALQQLVAGQLGSGFVQQVIGDLVGIVCSWFNVQCKVKNVSSEIRKVHKQARVMLRGTDPKLWIAAAQAYPGISTSVCKIVLKWPLNYEDRDLLVDAVGAVLPACTIPADPSSAAIGCQLGVMLSCGSERRVARLEQELLSAKVVEALGQYGDNDDVVVPAMGYLFNVAQCEELWPTLVQLDVGPLCHSARERLHNHPLVQEYAQYILDILHFVEYGQEGPEAS